MRPVFSQSRGLCRQQTNKLGNTYLLNAPNCFALENHHYERRTNGTADQAECPQFPCCFTFSCSCIDPQHKEEDIDGAQNVEYLERGVPWCIRLEDVQIPRYEYQTV
jgi:hypothetical protein